MFIGGSVAAVLLLSTITVGGFGSHLASERHGESDAIPRFADVEQAAKFVATEAKNSYAPGTPGFTRAASLSAMNLVETNVSAPRFAELVKKGDVPGTTPDEIWKAQAALCQGSSDAYQAVLRELGIGTRRLEIYWRSPNGQANSHSTVETRWAGRWHWLDPTYGVVYSRPDEVGDLLSFRQVRSRQPKLLHLNETDEWWMEGLFKRAANPVGFVSWPDSKVLWMPVKEPSSKSPEQVKDLQPLTAHEWRAPLRQRTF
jgi:transglutaminase superfamily protein